MARRRSAKRARELTFFEDAFLRVAGAIALDTLALVVWNVGTRSPLEVWRDVRDGVRRPATLLGGSVSAVVGLIFVAAATVLLLPAIPNPPANLAPAEIFTFLVALGLELLVGGDLRGATGSRMTRR